MLSNLLCLYQHAVIITGLRCRIGWNELEDLLRHYQSHLQLIQYSENLWWKRSKKCRPIQMIFNNDGFTMSSQGWRFLKGEHSLGAKTISKFEPFIWEEQSDSLTKISRCGSHQWGVERGGVNILRIMKNIAGQRMRLLKGTRTAAPFYLFIFSKSRTAVAAPSPLSKPTPSLQSPRLAELAANHGTNVLGI